MRSTNTVWHHAVIKREHREHQNAHKSVILWFTGLSGSGKSTLAHAIEEKLYAMGCRTYVLDGDNVRHGLCGDLGFSAEDRTENIRRIGEVAKLMIEAGTIVLTAFISPFRADREWVRGLVRHGDFLEIYCHCPIEVCEQRDVKGLYKKARAGEVKEFTGISSPYDEPVAPELIVETATYGVDECAEQALTGLRKLGVLTAGSQ